MPTETEMDNMSQPRTDADGFLLYTCSECGEEKIAALFMPSEIANSTLRCHVCTGDVGQTHRKDRRPTAAQQPRNIAIHTLNRQTPLVWKR